MNDQVNHGMFVRAALEPELARWKVVAADIRQRFNAPDEISLRLATDDLMADTAELLGKTITVLLEHTDANQEFSGIVESVEDGLVDELLLIIDVKVASALVSLVHRTNSRIFQDRTIPEILQQVLDEGLAPYGRSLDMAGLVGTYEPQEYTVQFNETDFDFVHRLMEESGINYHFVSSGGSERMVLSDSDAVYTDVPRESADGVLFMMAKESGQALREGVWEFRRSSNRRSTVARTVVFDWLSPDTPLHVESSHSVAGEEVNGAALSPEREEFRYEEPEARLGFRSQMASSSAAQAAVALRRAVQQRDAIVCEGRSTVVGVAPALKFELFEHPQRDLDGRYKLISIEHHFGPTMRGSHGAYTNDFRCIPHSFEWRPARRRPRPRIYGIQTATVVAPPGEEIHTDEHGRIKVQFHWDRQGKRDQNSSCFIRVVQPWAGSGWGVVFLPRVGMEVAVTFIDGDPDRPVVTGALYNGTHSPPYTLPDERTRTSIKSESSPGGGGFNELRFDDAAGREEVFIHAQRDFNETVLHDHNTTVGNSQTHDVGLHQVQAIHGNQTESIDGDQHATVGGDRSLRVAGESVETVGGLHSRTVTGDVTETFSASETRHVSGDRDDTIMGSVTRRIHGSQDETITGDRTSNISGSASETVTGDVSITTPATYGVTASGGITMTADAGIKMIAPGGFTVIAPGGTTTVDSFFEKHGGMSLDAFGFKLSVLGAKTEICGLALALLGNKTDIVGLKVDIAALSYKNSQMEVQQAITKVVNAYWDIKIAAIIAMY